MTTKRLALLGAVTLVVLVGWCLHWASNVSAPEVSLEATPATSAPATSSVPAATQSPEAPLALAGTPMTAKTERTPAAAEKTTASPVVQPTAVDEWLPPARTDKVFDLNGNGRVEADEQARADELLERAHQFASQRSKDGTYPILKPSFLGEGRFFRAVDTNADGALTEKEFLAYETDSIRELRRYDQNADGALTVAEYGHLKSRFDYLDEDQDGQLYAWEITLVRARGKW